MHMLIFALMLVTSTAPVATSTPPPPSPPPPLKALLITGGVCHDFGALVPELTAALERLVNVSIEVKQGLDVLDREDFARAYDVVIHDFCFDEAKDDQIAHALAAARAGKPAVFIHCAVHSFRNSASVREWEACCGMRSKSHDAYQAFGTAKADAAHPIVKAWPDAWTTPGDELYQTIELLPGAKALLTAKSPLDGREHVVCWTSAYGAARVFATTLGHDLRTAGQASYQQLLARGLLWACQQLDEQGVAKPGYGRPEAERTQAR